MCGISGIVSAQWVARSDIEIMNRALAHRGPDGAGVLVKEGVGFGHRRLSIIDLEGGSQPMTNDDGSVWIVFNGEIYNYRKLRRELEPRHAFRTHSDTEVILRFYEEEGEACLGKLRGMFAFAIYDFRKRRLLLARDHLGQKPLYYCELDAGLLFASEIKALLEARPQLRELDETALHEYLSLRIVTPPRSMFRRVRKLPPAHYLVFENGAVRTQRYWDLRFTEKHREPFPELLEELDRQVRDTVQYHLVSDVEVGAFLSGGMDSSLVVAMMRGLTGAPFKTFSGDVPYARYSELPYARAVSGRYGTEAHELTIVPSLVRALPTVMRHLDEPSDPLSVCMYSIAELASRYVKVVLGGDGGDELFGGYDRYYGNLKVSYYALLPEAVRRQVVSRLLRLLPEGYWYRSTSHKLRWMHQMSFHSRGDRYARSLSYFYFSDAYRRQLYGERLRRAAAVFDPEANLRIYFDGAPARELVDRMLYTDSLTRMPDHPIMVLDRTTMAHGLEARAPFLDHVLAEFCARIPPRFKVRGRRLRFIQYELARRYLPREVLERKKQGFSSPLPYLLADEFQRLYRALLGDARLVDGGFLNAEGVRALLNDHLQGRADHGQRLWQLCSAELWYRMYLGNESADTMSALIERAEVPAPPSSQRIRATA